MIKRLKYGMVNCYVLNEGNSSVLVDTTGKKSPKRLYKAVKNDNVKLIVITHGHNDHIGGALYLSEKLGVPIAMHKYDAELICDNTLQSLTANTFFGKVLLFFSKRTLLKKVAEFAPIILQNGDSLGQYGVNAKIIHLPGHTKGSIGVISDDGIIVGDAMFNIFSPIGSVLYNNKQEVAASLIKINNSGAKVAYVGHGAPIQLKK